MPDKLIKLTRRNGDTGTRELLKSAPSPMRRGRRCGGVPVSPRPCLPQAGPASPRPLVARDSCLVITSVNAWAKWEREQVTLEAQLQERIERVSRRRSLRTAFW